MEEVPAGEEVGVEIFKGDVPLRTSPPFYAIFGTLPSIGKRIPFRYHEQTCK